MKKNIRSTLIVVSFLSLFSSCTFSAKTTLGDKEKELNTTSENKSESKRNDIEKHQEFELAKFVKELTIEEKTSFDLLKEAIRESKESKNLFKLLLTIAGDKSKVKIFLKKVKEEVEDKNKNSDFDQKTKEYLSKENITLEDFLLLAIKDEDGDFFEQLMNGVYDAL